MPEGSHVRSPTGVVECLLHADGARLWAAQTHASVEMLLAQGRPRPRPLAYGRRRGSFKVLPLGGGAGSAAVCAVHALEAHLGIQELGLPCSVCISAYTCMHISLLIYLYIRIYIYKHLSPCKTLDIHRIIYIYRYILWVYDLYITSRVFSIVYAYALFPYLL